MQCDSCEIAVFNHIPCGECHVVMNVCYGHFVEMIRRSWKGIAADSRPMCSMCAHAIDVK